MVRTVGLLEQRIRMNFTVGRFGEADWRTKRGGWRRTDQWQRDAFSLCRNGPPSLIFQGY